MEKRFLCGAAGLSRFILGWAEIFLLAQLFSAEIVCGNALPTDAKNLLAAAPLPVPPPPEKPAESGVQVVTVGVYFYGFRALDFRANSYTADFYIWFLWAGTNDPTKSLEFMNAIGKPDQRPIFTNDSGADVPEVLPDGRKIQQYHVQGSFGHHFDLSKYPLDEHDLAIELEDTKASAQELRYQVDAGGLGIHDSLKIHGWVTRGVTGVARGTTYRTSFGDPRSKGDNTSPNVTFSLHITRPNVSSVLPVVAPLFFTLSLAFCGFFTTPQELGTRISLFAMAVMSVLFIHLAYVFDVPPDTKSRVDYLHMLCYMLLLASAVVAIMSSRLAGAREAEAAKRFDQRCFAVLLALFLVGTAGLLAFG